MTEPSDTPHDPPTEPMAEAPTEPMADPPTEPMAEPASGRPRRLVRSREDRIFAGVAGGLGRHFDVDPVIFRIVFGALTLAAGVGVFLYLAAVLFVPAEGAEGSPFETSRLATILGGGGLLFVFCVSIGSGGAALGPLVGVALLAGIVYASYRALRFGSGRGGPGAARILVWGLVGAGASIGLVVLSMLSLWISGSGGSVVIAVAIVALGVALIVLALAGKARRSMWLVLPALALALPLGIVSAAGVSFDGGFGGRTYRPASVGELPAGGYRLGAGGLEVDLRRVDFQRGTRTSLDVGIGMGYGLVRVPRGVCVRTGARIGGGAFSVGDTWQGGLDLDEPVSMSRPANGAPELALSGDIGLGGLEVVVGDDASLHAESGSGRSWEPRATRDAPLGSTATRQDPQAACTGKPS